MSTLTANLAHLYTGTPTLEYDPDVDALYIRVLDEPVAFTRSADDARWAIDYTGDGRIVGVEVLSVRRLTESAP